MEKDKLPQLVVPASVTAIISRIEAAQLTRAQEDISSQLSDILDNVNCVLNRFQEKLGYDLTEKAKSHQSEQKDKNRFILLEKIASFSRDAKTKEKHLYEILCWLAEWGDSLTYEISNRKSEEEEEGLDEWIEVMEKVLPLSLITTKGNIESLISLCSTLIEGQKERAQTSKHTFWQGWWEQSPQKSTSFPEPLSPEQMLQDKTTTCTRVSEVKSMLQELLDSTMFNQREVRAIRYMSSVVENLHQALMLQHKENRSLETKYRHLKTEMTKEICNQGLFSQQSLQVPESKRDARLKQVEILGGQYHDHLQIKHPFELQRKKAQFARGQAEDPAKIFVDSPGPLEEESPPKKEQGLEETQQEPEKKDQLFSPLSPSFLAMAGDSGARSSTYQPPSTTTTCSRIADVCSGKEAESPQPVLPCSVDHKFPKKWEKPVAESPGHKVKDQKDFFQGKEGLQINSHFREQLSSESSRKVALGNKVEDWEEKLIWERRRQRWLEEEEVWLQRQKKWALLEQEHQERLRQWEVEEVVKEQHQRRAQQDKEHGGPQREQPREDADRPTFVTTSQRRDLEKASLGPPLSQTQSAHQGRRPYLPRSPDIQQPTPRTRRPMRSADFTQKPRTRQVPTTLKKSASTPVPGEAIQKGTQTRLHISPVALKGKKRYHMGTEAQRKNLQLLREDAKQGLPQSLRRKALELTSTTMGLNLLRLQGLCHKYVLYRHFQSFRQEVINHVQATRETGATSKAQKFSTFLENTECLQALRLQALTDQQKALEEKHQQCLRSMVTMFPKLQLQWNIHLHTPVVTSPKPRKSKPPPSLHRRVQSSGLSCKQPPEHIPFKHRERVPLWMARQQGNQMEDIWKIEVASSSHQTEKKNPTGLSWDQLGGCPEVPPAAGRMCIPP